MDGWRPSFNKGFNWAYFWSVASDSPSQRPSASSSRQKQPMLYQVLKEYVFDRSVGHSSYASRVKGTGNVTVYPFITSYDERNSSPMALFIQWAWKPHQVKTRRFLIQKSMVKFRIWGMGLGAQAWLKLWSGASSPWKLTPGLNNRLWNCARKWDNESKILVGIARDPWLLVTHENHDHSIEAFVIVTNRFWFNRMPVQGQGKSSLTWWIFN